METDMPMNTVRSLGDDIKAGDDNIVAVISSLVDGKLTICCVCGKNAIKAGVTAPAVLIGIAKYVGGGGGGRPDSATAGAKDASKLGEAFASLTSIVESLVK